MRRRAVSKDEAAHPGSEVMPHRPKPITPEMLAQARRLYVETRVPVEDICAMLGIGTHAFYKRRKE